MHFWGIGMKICAYEGPFSSQKGVCWYNHVALLKECANIMIALLLKACLLLFVFLRCAIWSTDNVLLSPRNIENSIGTRLSQVDEPLYDSGS